jgi:hypothetical protein
VHIGANAGKTGQGANTVAIGNNAGFFEQGTNAIAIGNNAGATGQGANSIHLNSSGTTGVTRQGVNSILLNSTNSDISCPANSIILAGSTGTITGATANAFYVEPIREATVALIPENLLGYNNLTSELTYFSNANLFVSNKVVANNNAAGTTSSNTYNVLTGGGTNPSVTITTGTSVFVTITSYYSSGVNGLEGYVGFAISGDTSIAATDTQALILSGRNATNNFTQCSATFLVTGLNAGTNIFTLNYKVSTVDTCTFQNRTIIVERYN